MRRIAHALALLALFSIPLQGLTTSHSRLPPSGRNIVISYDSAVYFGGHAWQHGSGIAIDIGQTFYLTRSIRLDRITVKIRALTDISREVVTVRIGRYTDRHDHSMNEVIRVETGILPRDLPVDGARYVTFDLANPVTLDRNAQYGFVIGFAGGGGVNNARGEMLHTGSDVFESGQAVAELGAFTQELAEDLIFFLHEVSSVDPPSPPVPPDADEILFLHGARFRATAYWRTPQGLEGYGQAVTMTDESGCFWFFREENVEVILKVLDGCGVNNRYWIFMAGLTNVEVRIDVYDLQSGLTRTYFNPMGRAFLPIFDTNAMASCP